MFRPVRSFLALSLLSTIAAAPCLASAHKSTVTGATDLHSNSLNAHFASAARKACRDRGFDHCSLIDIQREQLSDDIAHYAVVLQVGEGEFDAITVHRIVKEHKHRRSAHPHHTFFFLHGSGNQFTFSMLNAAKTDGLGLYLAKREVDVWGVDLRWVRIPRTQTDFAFMREWGVDLHVRDIQLAMRFARYARWLTGQHFGRLNLAGASLGATLAFAAANDEVTRPVKDRDVGGLIPMDTVYALAAESAQMRLLACNAEAAQRVTLANGVFAQSGLRGQEIGRLALTDPDGVSPFAPSLTNRQLALNNAAAFAFAPLAYHVFGVTRSAQAQPMEGRFTHTAAIFETQALGTSYRAVATFVDYFAIPCGDASQHHLAHLGEIAVPVLYVGYAGGFGRDGLHTLTLLGSADVTVRFVQLLDDTESKDDFGHSDWLNATDAVSLIRRPIWRWIERH